MSATSLVQAASEGEGFTPPGPIDFEFPPIPGLDFGSSTIFGLTFDWAITKPMALLVIGGIVTFVLLRAAAAKREMVPGRYQFAGEAGYGFVRNTLGRDIIGSDKFLPYVPFLVVLFFFILVNNFMTQVPFIQIPTMSRVSFPYTLAVIVWLVYIGAGMKRFGALGYLKNQTVPQGIPWFVLPLVVPLEAASNLIVRPVTLSLRLFANMFAGHILVVLFAVGGQYMLLEAGGLVAPFALVSWAAFIAIAFLEILIQFLQAFIFTILAALYIASSVAEEH